MVVVIGSGLGGLATAAILARQGMHVTVVEQAQRIGGCLQCFTRDGMCFDTGMHIVGSADTGQVLDGYLRYLGIRENLQLSRLDTQAYDIVSLDGACYRFANGHEAATEALLRHFPSSAAALQRYWDAVDSVTSAAPRYDAKGLVDGGCIPPDLAWAAASDVLSAIAGDERLANALAGNIALYAACRGTTPFATHAFVSQLYNQSAFRIVGGGEALAGALARQIEACGGTIVKGCRATRVVCDGGKATAVECVKDGRPVTFEADTVVGDMHPALLRGLFDQGLLKPSYLTRIEGLRNTTSVFALFLRFKPNTVPYLNSNYHAFRQPTVWGMEHYSQTSWPLGYLYMHHAHELYPRYASTGVVLAYMNWDEVLRWSNTTVGHRGADYEEWKDQKARQLLDAVTQDFPGLRSSIAAYYTATPLTYRDYTLTPQGSMYGIAKDIRQGMAGRVSFRTKIPNFLLTGQNITAHGIMGVLIGAFNVCNNILSMPQTAITNRNKKMESEPPTPLNTLPPDVVIMGGGLGGLLCGALLSKEKKRVVVLEAGATAGGGLATFRRDNVAFPTGMHVFGGFGDNSPLSYQTATGSYSLRPLMRYLGIESEVLSLLEPTNDSCGDQIVDIATGNTLDLPHGRKAFVDYLSARYPDSKDDIAAYVDAIYSLAAEETNLFMSDGQTFTVSEQFLWPLDKFMRHYVKDADLRRLLTYVSPLYAGVGSCTPAYIHAIVATLHIEGTYLFKQPSSHLADLLSGIITEAGGSVRTGDAVTNFSVHNHNIVSVRTASGMQYEAACYVSDLPTNVLLRVAPTNAFPRSFVSRLREAPVTYSAFKIFVTLKPGTFRHLDHPVYFVGDQPSGAVPQSLMLTTIPATADGSSASALTAIAPMSWQAVERWADTSHHNRPDDYKAWKKACCDRLLDIIATAFPGFRNSVAAVECATPLTLRDWTGNACGNLYGLLRDANNILASQLSPRTKLSNLFLTGQDVNIHGMVGVAMTAMLTVEALLGTSELHKKILTFARE